MDSSMSFDQYRQNVSITEDNAYLLTVVWLAPIRDPLGKHFQITLNNNRLQNITCNASNADYKFQKVEIIVNLNVGTAEIFMQMYGTTPDYCGFYIA